MRVQHESSPGVEGAAEWRLVLAQFAAELRERGRRVSTIRGYVAHLRSLEEFVECGPWSVTRADVEDWLEDRDASARNAWKVARRFYSWGERLGQVAATPVPSRLPADHRAGVRALEADAAMYVRWREPIRRHLTLMRAAGLGDGSCRLYLTYLRRFANDHPDPWAVTVEEVAAWLANPAWGPETRKSARRVLARFYADADRPDHAPSPVETIRPPRVPRHTPRPADEEVLARALTAASPRVRLMLLLGAYAGLRAGEIAAVHPASDLSGGVLFVRGKGGDERRVPLHPRLARELGEELERRAVGDFGESFYPYERDLPTDPAGLHLFPNGRDGHLSAQYVSVLLSRALPAGVTAHMLRHRFATGAFRASRDLRAVQELLGHASPKTTAIYTLTTDGDLSAAVNGLR